MNPARIATESLTPDPELENSLGQYETKLPVEVKVDFMAKTGNLRAKLLLDPTLQTSR